LQEGVVRNVFKKTNPKSIDFGAYFFLGDCILFSKKMKLFSKTKLINSHLHYKNNEELFFYKLIFDEQQFKTDERSFCEV